MLVWTCIQENEISEFTTNLISLNAKSCHMIYFFGIFQETSCISLTMEPIKYPIGMQRKVVSSSLTSANMLHSIAFIFVVIDSFIRRRRGAKDDAPLSVFGHVKHISLEGYSKFEQSKIVKNFEILVLFIKQIRKKIWLYKGNYIAWK